MIYFTFSLIAISAGFDVVDTTHPMSAGRPSIPSLPKIQVSQLVSATIKSSTIPTAITGGAPNLNNNSQGNMSILGAPPVDGKSQTKTPIFAAQARPPVFTPTLVPTNEPIKTTTIATTPATLAMQGTPKTLQLNDLLRVNQDDLDQMYLSAVPTPESCPPIGYLHGLVLAKPGCPDNAQAAKHFEFWWKGKYFCSNDCSLINRMAFGVQAFRGRVYRGLSLMDGRPTLVIDYPNSLLARNVRDELREIAPGVHLGRMYMIERCGPRFVVSFALDARKSKAQQMSSYPPDLCAPAANTPILRPQGKQVRCRGSHHLEEVWERQ